ncbi:hypothetical protein [Mycolicibacterium sp. XJ1819]
MTDARIRPRGGRLGMSRSRGAMSGFLLILLGLWGALIPFVGPYFDFAFNSDAAWTWTTARGWLEVLPGAAVALGGLLLLVSGNRATAMLGGWLAVAGGAWFVVGRALAGPLGIGEVGAPVAATEAKAIALDLAYFSGLGALIVFLGALALGRISVRSVRDIEFVDSPVAHTTATTTSDATDTARVTDPDATDTTEMRPAGAPVRSRRSWRDVFNRRHTHAH